MPNLFETCMPFTNETELMKNMIYHLNLEKQGFGFLGV